MFKIYAKTDYIYYIKYYKNVYDYKPIKLQINKYKFEDWASDKVNMTKKNEVKYIAPHQQEEIELSQEEKNIMNYIYKQVQKQGYIVEKDIAIDNYSKALIQQTVKNKDILKQYNLKRCRLNKKLKQELRITTKGYPFIITEV